APRRVQASRSRRVILAVVARRRRGRALGGGVLRQRVDQLARGAIARFGGEAAARGRERRACAGPAPEPAGLRGRRARRARGGSLRGLPVGERVVVVPLRGIERAQPVVRVLQVGALREQVLVRDARLVGGAGAARVAGPVAVVVGRDRGGGVEPGEQQRGGDVRREHARGGGGARAPARGRRAAHRAG